MESMTTTPVITPAPTWTNSEVLQKAWDGIKGNLPFTVALTLVLGFGIWVANLVPFIGFLLATPLTAGYVRCLLTIRRGETVAPTDFLWGFMDANRFLQLILIQILLTVGTTIGFLLLLIPGIWFLVATCLANTEYILNGGDAVSSIKKSIELVKGHWWKYTGLLGVLFLLNVVGAICLLLGLLVTGPVTVLALVVVVEAASADARPAPHP